MTIIPVIGGNYSAEQLQSGGIYAIIHTETGRIYYGSTNRFKQRWRAHIYRLDKGTHCNSALQADWQEFGAGAFVFQIVEFVSRWPIGAMHEREMYYIKSASTELYNMWRW